MLDIDTEFFNYSPDEWLDRASYKAAREVVTHLRVVNDGAERAVRLFTCYNKTVTKKEESQQNLLVSVHAFRKSKPDNKKVTLIDKYDRQRPKSC